MYLVTFHPWITSHCHFDLAGLRSVQTPSGLLLMFFSSCSSLLVLLFLFLSSYSSLLVLLVLLLLFFSCYSSLNVLLFPSVVTASSPLVAPGQ